MMRLPARPSYNGKPELASAIAGSSAAQEQGSKLSALQQFNFVLASKKNRALCKIK